ncbi:auxin efflux carrier component 5-like [Punica granatum]|uniref:Uncharacterized protein n=2 Tax=Punica granatum TaxID=22663 RepID=A0A218XPD4_PUNGR|nr:auxin efflux carrier component 5-like [Punica granatum]OWM86132.1 hypothetical protein CDL15_Pgr010956 [Punica granatum]PKI33485.1 hypothetical protein CRG98_046134 [Punica granatum]
MIGFEDISKVVVGMVPLYVALLLGYGSVRWWRLFTPEQCDGINRFICLFIFPLFSFDFTANVDPFLMNYRLIAADAVSKVITIMGFALWWAWARFGAGGPRPSGSLNSCVTGFSLSTLTNLLVVGVPAMSPMYGPLGMDLVIQLSVVQSLVWFPLLLMFLEFRKTRMESLQMASSGGVGANSTSSDDHRHDQTNERDIEGTGNLEADNMNPNVIAERSDSSSRWGFMRVAGIKLAMNPNVIAVVLGVAWALAAHWLKFKMPGVIKGSISILSRAGTGTAMFNIGIFMATQKKIIACGKGPTALGMILRFIVGPAVMAFSSFVMGLHGDPFRIAIIQAALPQSIASFVYAKEYGLHANVISTAVVFGTLVSLPLLIGYYAALQYL